tara:strand:- start:727 stop:942 length:216 start_codon:yes stop_codon:yes gene_type:complete
MTYDPKNKQPKTYIKNLYDFEQVKTKDQFIEEVYEIAFGDDAINRDYSMPEVLERLMEFSDNALKWEETNG